MVAKGDDDKPTQVPALILENPEQVKRFIEALKMREIKRKIREEMDDARAHIHLEEATKYLQGERCVIGY
jgi:hypothetical protein